MKRYFVNEENILILIALLKAYGINKVVASPGTTNLSFVASIQSDPFFQVYSCIDERSAAYMACGLSEECNCPVVITCTGATASRNYFSALTEAYYRKIPIVAVTGTQYREKIGHLHAQVIDRTVLPKDTAKLSVYIPSIKDGDDAYYCNLNINRALAELTHRGGGPVHIDLGTIFSRNFSIKTLPTVRVIKRISYDNLNDFPEMNFTKIVVFIGAHHIFTEKQTFAIEQFCKSRNAIVLCDHTSGYYGNYKINNSLVASQKFAKYDVEDADLCIHLGEISGDYASLAALKPKEVWRVNLDGEFRDPFRRLRYVFELTEDDFFLYYTVNEKSISALSNFDYAQNIYNGIFANIPDLPFSNVWAASKLISHIPDGAVVHLGILNSLRSWNLFKFKKTVITHSNVGGFGIDGCLSSCIGASFSNPNKLYFAIIGDLAFFYDMNSLGNRHIGNNLRVLIINNGKGTEFKNFYHTGALFGSDADKYIAAAGHFGNKVNSPIKSYVTALGFEYISAKSKEEFDHIYLQFVSLEKTRPIVFEIFTDDKDESDALLRMWEIKSNTEGLKVKRKQAFQQSMAKIIGRNGLEIIRILKQK